MTIPKKLGLRRGRALVIPAGSFFLTIPLVAIQREAEKWLSTKKGRRGLKTQAEKAARNDAVNRAKRGQQL